MIIDVHSHLFPPEYLHRIEKIGGWQPRLNVGPLHRLTVGERLDLMDSDNVDVQVLSVGSLQPYARDRPVAMDLARFANDIYLQTCADLPGRFAMFAALPLPHVDAAIEEIDRLANERGVVGVAFGTSVLGRQLDDRVLRPLYEALNDRAATVFLHPLMTYDGFGPNDYGMNHSVGSMVEDTIAVLRLLFSGISARNPRIRFIVPHLGGTLPFVYGRIRRHVDRSEQEWHDSGVPGQGDDAGQGLRRFWFDTATRHAPALACAWATVGHDRLVFGTDYPYLTTAGELAARIHDIRDLPMPPSAHDAILGATAAAMLGLGPATSSPGGDAEPLLGI